MPPVSGRTLLEEIEGIPGWADSARYTIDARVERPAAPEMMRGPMMQALLEERFHLKIRRRDAGLRVDDRGRRAEASAGPCRKLHSLFRNGQADERRADEVSRPTAVRRVELPRRQDDVRGHDDRAVLPVSFLERGSGCNR
jgi:hypothetical protein